MSSVITHYIVEHAGEKVSNLPLLIVQVCDFEERLGEWRSCD